MLSDPSSAKFCFPFSTVWLMKVRCSYYTEVHMTSNTGFMGGKITQLKLLLARWHKYTRLLKDQSPLFDPNLVLESEKAVSLSNCVQSKIDIYIYNRLRYFATPGSPHRCKRPGRVRKWIPELRQRARASNGECGHKIENGWATLREIRQARA